MESTQMNEPSEVTLGDALLLPLSELMGVAFEHGLDSARTLACTRDVVSLLPGSSDARHAENVLRLFVGVVSQASGDLIPQLRYVDRFVGKVTRAQCPVDFLDTLTAFARGTVWRSAVCPFSLTDLSVLTTPLECLAYARLVMSDADGELDLRLAPYSRRDMPAELISRGTVTDAVFHALEDFRARGRGCADDGTDFLDEAEFALARYGILRARKQLDEARERLASGEDAGRSPRPAPSASGPGWRES